jgi:Ca-activated chloride channel family protein
MIDKTDIRIDTRWDKNVVPADEAKKRGLLIDIVGIGEKRTERRAINLALVIDRSGSMNGGKIEAAKEAAKGVVERLGKDDVLSVVDFDSEISTLVDGVRMTKDGKREAISAIDRLRARGTTNLAGGWLEGATRAAEAMDTMDFKSGHVVLLSDGHANEGITDPATLQAYADEMASRGVTTSTVGVGNGYSPLQLDALSEGGLGRLHDAATPDEMIETILGELGEVVSVVATDVKVNLRWPRELRTKLLADYRAELEGNAMTVRLGQLLGGARRTLPLMIDVPALPLGEVMKIEIAVTGKHPESGDAIKMVAATAKLAVVTAAESYAVERDRDVAERIARLWESTMGLDAMRLNEQGDFVAASNLVQDIGEDLALYAAGTAVEGSIRHNLQVAAHKVSNRWDGRSKRESLTAARKFSKGEQDHRSDPRGDWSDNL